MRDRPAVVLFSALSVLLLPVTLAGYVLWVLRLAAGRRSGVSATAQGPLSARWLQDRLGTRPDEPAHRLLGELPGVSPTAVRLVFGPTLLAHRLSGYVPAPLRYPFEGEVSLRNQALARQTLYDGVVDRYLPDVAQLVVLGAGFDTRALRLPGPARVRSFEVDEPGTLATKRRMVHRAGVDATGVSFVAADLARGDWLDRLVEAGFDTAAPALLLWEGVTPYLDRAAVEDTLRRVAGLAPGTVVAFDCFTTEVLESRELRWRVVRAALRAGGEPLRFGLDSTPPVRDGLVALLRSCGLVLDRHRVLGRETGGQRAWGGFATAVVP